MVLHTPRYLQRITGKNRLKGYDLGSTLVTMKFNGMRLQTILIFVLMAGLLMSCSQASRQQDRNLEFRFNRGQDYFENGKYYKAIEEFKFVVLNNPGGEMADDAQLYLADSHFEVGEYVVAASEYRRLMRRYPESPLVEQAQYKLGMCFVELSPHYQLDQDYTRQAITTLQNFLEQYPNSKYSDKITRQIQTLRNKLAHKSYSNGHLYFILDQYDSALIYYNNLLDQYYDTEWANQARLERAKCLIELGRQEEALAQVEELLTRSPNQDIRVEARRLRDELRKQVGVAMQGETGQ